MINPIERAAQIWCLPQFANREMDAAFAEAIADAIRDGILAGLEDSAEFLEIYGANLYQGNKQNKFLRKELYDMATAIRAKVKEIREGKA